MSRRFVTSSVCALLACSCLLFASIGCSPGTPTAPSLAPQNVVESPNFVRILSTSKDVQGPMLSDGEASKLICAEDGGFVSNGRVTLEFPPNALSEDTEITIETYTDGTLTVELGPHGIEFNAPVIMTVDLTGTTAETMSSATTTIWYNPNENWWETITKLESGDSNVVSASLEHFSKFSQQVGG